MRLTTSGGNAAASGLFAALDIGPENELVGIEMPTAWTAASITFRVSLDGVTYYDLYDDSGAEATLTVAASTTIGFRANIRWVMRPWRYLILRSGTAGAVVNQAASRTIAAYVVRRGA